MKMETLQQAIEIKAKKELSDKFKSHWDALFKNTPGGWTVEVKDCGKADKVALYYLQQAALQAYLDFNLASEVKKEVDRILLLADEMLELKEHVESL